MNHTTRSAIQPVTGQSDTSAKRIAWIAPTRVHGSASRLTHTLLVVAIVVLSVIDAYLLLPALQSVMRLSPPTTEKIAYGVSAAATLAAGWTGWHVRGAAGNHPGDKKHLVLPVLVALGWLALGGGIFVIRLVGKTTRAAVGYDGVAAPTGPVISAADWTGASLFLAFYVLVGLLAMGDMYHLRQDAAAALRRATRQRARTIRLLTVEEGLLRRLVEVHSIRQLETQLLPLRVNTAKQGNADHALELKQLSRHEQAIAMGSPSGTGITSPEHPMNPASVARSDA